MHKIIILLASISCVMSLPVQQWIRRHAHIINKRSLATPTPQEEEEFMKMIRNDMFETNGVPLDGSLTPRQIIFYFRNKMGVNPDLAQNLGRDYLVSDRDNDGRLNKHELLDAMKTWRTLDLDRYL